MRTSIALLVVAVGAGMLGTACSERSQNVRPPRLGAPTVRNDVVGIYRSGNGDLLQLRANGVVNLTTRRGADGGRFDVRDGSFDISTSSCPPAQGHYRVEVTGQQASNRAVLQFTVVDDPCAPRRDALLGERWVYVES